MAGTSLATPPEALGDCVYELDAELRIRAVDAAWSAFAAANAAPELGAGLVGRHLFECIREPTTTVLYRRAFERVRDRGGPIVVSYRCDSPSLRRFMELEISAAEAGGFRVRTRVVRVEPREPVALLAHRGPGSGPPVRMCSWCKRVDVRGRWLEVEDAVAELRLFDEAALPPISHGICDGCEARVTAELDRSDRGTSASD